MERYRQTVKTRRAYLGAAVLIIAVLLTAQTLGWFPIGKETFYDGFLTGFLGGGLTGIELVFVFLFAKYSKALRDNQILETMYIKENDEREKTIRSKIGGFTMYICALVILVAGIVAGNYNQTVFFTLISCASFLFLVIGILKIYYMKKL